MNLPVFSSDTLSNFLSTASHDESVIVLFAEARDGKALLLSSDSSLASLQSALNGLGASAKRDELTKIWSEEHGALFAVAGVGDKVNAASLRYAAGSAARQLNQKGKTTAAFFSDGYDVDQQEAIAEGALLGSYTFNQYRSNAEKKASLASLVMLTSTDVPEEALGRAAIIGAAVAESKDLINIPAMDLYPEKFTELVEARASEHGLTVTVWDERKLEAEGFGGISGVGKGSVRPPRLVKIEYAPAGATTHLALAGKGITFDTGGLSLKPAGSMVGMKYDMAGAAVAWSVIRAAAQLQLPIRITSWLALAENMPSGQAIRPNDILTIRGGKTVEVLNTDAEGRLVLADALAVASEEHPDFLVDIATLTGAATVALGNRTTGVMGEENFVAEMLAAAEEAAEQFWPVPLSEDLRSLLDSELADIANARPGNSAGGMILGGLFLQEFVGKQQDGSTRIPWVHLDIAPTANNDGSGYGFTGTGPTGIAIRTLLKLAEKISKA